MWPTATSPKIIAEIATYVLFMEGRFNARQPQSTWIADFLIHDAPTEPRIASQ